MTGRTLKEHRELLGLTGSEVARALGVLPSAVTHLERRDSVLPTTAEKYLAACAVLARKRQDLALALQIGQDVLAGRAG